MYVAHGILKTKWMLIAQVKYNAIGDLKYEPWDLCVLADDV
jgi:hypothetical protein